MKNRFADLKKIPKDPAMRMLAVVNVKLKCKLDTPANASVETVLTALDKADAHIDMLRMMSIALPPRERVWWACLAARDVIGADVEKTPGPLAAAEGWVRKPSDETRDAARAAVELADIDDDTVLCATSVVFCDDTLGTGDLAQYPAPPGASQSAAFGMNVMALATGDDLASKTRHLMDRAIDIARGGSGNVPAPEAPQKEEAAT